MTHTSEGNLYTETVYPYQLLVGDTSAGAILCRGVTLLLVLETCQSLAEWASLLRKCGVTAAVGSNPTVSA